MCEQCMAETESWDILPGIALVRATADGSYMKKGQWGLVICNDPFCIWDKIPIPDYSRGLTEEDDEKYWDSQPESVWTNLLETVRDIEKALHICPRTGYELIKACIEKGYNIKDIFGWWFCDYMGRFILNNKSTPHIEG